MIFVLKQICFDYSTADVPYLIFRALFKTSLSIIKGSRA